MLADALAGRGEFIVLVSWRVAAMSSPGALANDFFISLYPVAVSS